MDPLKTAILYVSELEIPTREAILRIIGLEPASCQLKLNLTALAQAQGRIHRLIGVKLCNRVVLLIHL